jgi:hypothetical protein
MWRLVEQGFGGLIAGASAVEADSSFQMFGVTPGGRWTDEASTLEHDRGCILGAKEKKTPQDARRQRTRATKGQGKGKRGGRIERTAVGSPGSRGSAVWNALIAAQSQQQRTKHERPIIIQKKGNAEMWV